MFAVSAWQLAAHKEPQFSPERRGDNQSDIGEPGRRIEHTAGGRNLETSELRTGTLWTAVVDTMIAALPAPATRALGWPVGCGVLSTKLHDLCAPRA